MKWEIDKRPYANGEVLYLGPWPVGGAHYDGTTAKGSRDKYRASCKLPGIARLGLHETREQAKERVEQAVTAWLDKVPNGEDQARAEADEGRCSESPGA